MEQGTHVSEETPSATRPRDWDGKTSDRVANPHVRWGQRVLDWLELAGDERVLDAGCGERPRDGAAAGAPAARTGDCAGRVAEHAAGGGAPPGSGGGPGGAVAGGPVAAGPPVHAPVDAVFSTATFHWIADHGALFRNLAAVLQPGGQLVAQCGGAGNIASVLAAIERLRHGSNGLAGWAGPWTFAGPDETRRRFEAAGSRMRTCGCNTSQAPLEPGEPLETFLATVILGAHLDRLNTEERPGFVKAVAAACPARRSTMCA